MIEIAHFVTFICLEGNFKALGNFYLAVTINEISKSLTSRGENVIPINVSPFATTVPYIKSRANELCISWLLISLVLDLSPNSM